MKLATLKDGSRDGQLLVVSRDLRSAVIADSVAPNLQRVLDDWSFHAPQLAELYTSLNRGEARRAFVLDPAECMAPLPRAYRRVGMANPWASLAFHASESSEASQACDASESSKASESSEASKMSHTPEANAASAAPPLLIEQAGDDHAGPRDPLFCPANATGIAIEAGLAVMTGELPQGVTADDALAAVLLVALASDALVREAPGAGPVDARDPAAQALALAFAPAAVSLDELGPAWREGRLHCRIVGSRDGAALAQSWPQSGDGHGFGEALARLARTRPVRAGTVVVLRCLAAPLQAQGAPLTGRLGFDARDERDHSIFGATDQPLRPAPSPASA